MIVNINSWLDGIIGKEVKGPETKEAPATGDKPSVVPIPYETTNEDNLVEDPQIEDDNIKDEGEKKFFMSPFWKGIFASASQSAENTKAIATGEKTECPVKTGVEANVEQHKTNWELIKEGFGKIGSWFKGLFS